MNIDFVSASTLPGIQHKAFKEDARYPNAIYESEIDCGDGVLSFIWDIMTGDLKSVYLGRYDQSGVTFSNVKTYMELKQLLSFLPLPYPENWP